MKNKQRVLSFVSVFMFTICLLTNIALPPQVASSWVNTKTVYAQTVKAVKVTAGVDNKTPKQNSVVKVTVNGPAKGTVKIVCHYKSTNTTYKGTIASNGKIVIPVKISRATKGYTVVINVSVTNKGKVYTTKTSFKPR